MVNDDQTTKASEARRDGYVVLDVTGGPIRLSSLLTFAQDLFPNHTLEQLAITEADDDEFVIAAETAVTTRAS